MPKLRSRTTDHYNPDGPAFSRVRLGSGPASLNKISAALGPVVYFIRTDDELIKIGHTVNLDRRKRVLGVTWQQILAIVPGSRADEAATHRQFVAHLAKGREYFHPASDLLDHIDGIRQRYGISPVQRVTSLPNDT